MLLSWLCLTHALASPPISVHPPLQVLERSGEDMRARFDEAGSLLGDWQISLAGVPVDGAMLTELAATRPGEPFTRVVREAFRQPVDLEDFLRFIDDVLVAGEAGRRGDPFWIGSGRARSAGILLHPDDIFRDRPRRYGRRDTLHVDQPAPQQATSPAEDGAGPGPGWTMRYRNPDHRREMIASLRALRPRFADALVSLSDQLEAQGASVYWNATVRSPERGYLMWGAFKLSRCTSAQCVETTIGTLDDRNRAWSLDVPIRWRVTDDWRQTIEQARSMADAYDVVYATERGARFSSHYGGMAVDIVAVGLPPTVSLRAPDDAGAVFDLTDPESSRDLSLSPDLIAWIETHFEVRKLRSDYPHWSDARTP